MNDNYQYKITILSEEAGSCSREFTLKNKADLSRFVFGIAETPYTSLTIEHNTRKNWD